MLRELIQSAPTRIERLFLLEDWQEDWMLAQLKESLTIEWLDQVGLKQISALKTPNTGLAVVKMPAEKTWPQTSSQPLVLYLDGIQDPGNLGSILRIADWFGLAEIWAAPGTVDVYNPKVIQAAMGAFLRVHFRSEVLLDDLPSEWQEVAVIGADMGGETMHHLEPKQPSILVVGSEGSGIRPQTKTNIDQLISIPKGLGGGAESLNAAVATGILCATLLK